MALVTVIAGRYSGTYTVPAGAAVTLGILQDPGWRLSFTINWEKVNDTDAYGVALIEKILLGFSQVMLDFTCKEYTDRVLRAANPTGTTTATGVTTFRQGVVGRRGTDLAGAVILTATAGTPAASSPATATFTTVAIADNATVEWIFGPRHRRTPLRLEAIAYDGGSGAAEWWSAT